MCILLEVILLFNVKQKQESRMKSVLSFWLDGSK
jgi:hypothetical protein